MGGDVFEEGEAYFGQAFGGGGFETFFLEKLGRVSSDVGQVDGGSGTSM